MTTKPRSEQTITATTTPDERPGWLITCDCASHHKGMGAAIVLDRGYKFDRKLVHGTILLAYHPGLEKAANAKGIWRV